MLKITNHPDRVEVLVTPERLLNEWAYLRRGRKKPIPAFETVRMLLLTVVWKLIIAKARPLTDGDFAGSQIDWDGEKFKMVYFRGSPMQDSDYPVVDVAASGYEFICPQCETLNRLVEYKAIVECQNCHAKVRLGIIQVGVG